MASYLIIVIQNEMDKDSVTNDHSPAVLPIAIIFGQENAL